MNETPDMLDFVKAMSDADRLRIIGVLAQRSARAAEVASELGMPVRDAFNHLEFLNFVGVVRKNEDVYELDEGGMEALSKRQFAHTQRESYTPRPRPGREVPQGAGLPP